MRRNAAKVDKNFLSINPSCNNTLAVFLPHAARVFLVFLKKGLASQAVLTYNFVPLLQRRKRSNGGDSEGSLKWFWQYFKPLWQGFRS